MPSIAQQDYIVIDWKGYSKETVPSDLRDEILTTLRKIYNTNPLTLLSVVMNHYGDNTAHVEKIISVGDSAVAFYSYSEGEIVIMDV